MTELPNSSGKTEKSIEDFRGEVPAKALANLILDWSAKQGLSRTNLDLQKLVYFCHVSHLVQYGEPLIRESFEAWQYGPVIPSLYKSLKKFGSNVVDGRLTSLSTLTCRQEVVKYDWTEEKKCSIERTLEIYGHLSTSHLVQISHENGSPWDTRYELKSEENTGSRIFNSEILNFYSRKKEFLH